MLDTEKREIVRRLLKALPSMSDSRIALMFGCDAKDVNRIRRDMIASGELPGIEADEDEAEDI